MTPGSKKPARKFDPALYESVHLFGEEFEVQPRSDIRTMRYAASGAKGTVYKLMSKRNRSIYGLKVFRLKYRNPEILSSCQQLKLVENYEGMLAANRRIVLPDDPIVRLHPELEYAVLMPWVAGDTWYDVLVRKTPYSVDTGMGLCKRFLTVMEGLEKSGIAHTDIAPGNVVVREAGLDTQLLDLEDLYTPQARRPARENLGQDGYQHQSAGRGKTLWCPEGDRYSSAVLAAELLVMSNPALANHAGDTGYFGGNCRDAKSQERFEAAQGYLRSLAPDFAKVFTDSWWKDPLERCPKISELRVAIANAQAPRILPGSSTTEEYSNAAYFDGTPITASPVPNRPRGRSAGAANATSPPAAATSRPSAPARGEGFGWSIPEPRVQPASGKPPKKKRGKRVLLALLLIVLGLLLLWAMNTPR